MKNLVLGLAVACLTLACASQQNAVEDAGTPGAACSTKSEKANCEEATECSTEQQAECATEKAECSTEPKVCPVSGKPIS